MIKLFKKKPKQFDHFSMIDLYLKEAEEQVKAIELMYEQAKCEHHIQDQNFSRGGLEVSCNKCGKVWHHESMCGFMKAKRDYHKELLDQCDKRLKAMEDV